MSTRVRFVVDGFNVYHAVREVERRTGAACRWLDLVALCASSLPLIDPAATVESVQYFSALAHHLEPSSPGTVARHERYLAALRATGVTTHLGVFKPKHIRYHSATCDVVLRRHEEKETDAAIAAAVVEAACSKRCEAVALVSGDTDIAPALRAARRVRPAIGLFALFPPFRANRALRRHVDRDFKISPAHLSRHLLPDPVTCSDGREVAKPTAW
jgi:hypothetical protein